MLWKWDADRTIIRTKLIQSFDLEKQIWLLTRIAVQFHEARQRFADRSFVTNCVSEHLPRFGVSATNASSILDELSSHTGLITKFTEDTFGFSHLALQEFLTAKWFSNEQRWRELITLHRMTDPWWQNVIPLCSALLSDASNLFRAALAIAGAAPALETLANCLKQDPIVDIELRDQVLRTILQWYHNGTAAQHDAALSMLVGIEDDWSTPVVVRSLNGRLPTKTLAKLLRYSGADESDAQSKLAGRATKGTASGSL